MLNQTPLPREQRWLRFILGGSINTAFTYGMYLALNLVLNYQWAYFIAYVLGIVFAYWFNASVVFRVPLTWKGLFAYPLVYVIQYGIGACLLGILVTLVHVPESLAPLAVAIITMPITYLMSKLIIKLTHKTKSIFERRMDNEKKFNAPTVGQDGSDLMERAKTSQIWPALVVPVIAIVLAIWLPFGFALTGVIEEWDVLGQFNIHGLFFIADANSPLAAHALRPLTVFPHAIAYFFDPNSFYYWHVLLMLALIVKGSASSHLIWKATGSPGWAMVMGALVLVYPADTMQLAFRGLHINWAIALLLLASSVFIIAYEQKRPVISYSLSILAALLFFAANCMYEAVLALAPLPLLILCVRDGFRAVFYQFYARMGIIAVWVAGAGLYIIYVILVAPKIASYHSYLVGGNTVASLIAAIPKLFSIGMLRGLLGGWFDAVRMVSTEFNTYTYLVIAMMIMGSLALFLIRSRDRLNMQNPNIAQSVEEALLARLAITGLLLLLLGYVPFLFNPYYLHISQRTFLAATPGAAMVWIALLIMISRSTKLLAGLTALALIFFGFGAQLFQFHHYVRIAEKQRTLLRSIVENFDGNLGGKTLVLLDESNQINHTWMLFRGSLPLALSYLYGHSINSIEVCYMPSKEWQRPDAQGRKGTCMEGENEWLFRYPEAVSRPGYIPALAKDRRIAKSQIITVRIKSDGSVFPNPELDKYRKNLFDGESTVAQRYRGVLAKSSWPFSLTMFEDQKARDRYRWNFGDWWNLDLPVRGAGWHGAEWKVKAFYHQSLAWKAQEKSMLYFDLLPTESHYILHGKFVRFINDQIQKSMRIRLNQHDQPFHWTSEGEFETEIQPGILLSGNNEIEFNSAVDPKNNGLSAMLDWFEVYPKNN